MNFILLQWSALKKMFEEAEKEDKTDFRARELNVLLGVGEYKAILLFMFPILKDLRRITKLFQTKTGNNLQIYAELKQFVLDLCRRILKPSVLKANNVYQLLNLDLTTNFNLLSLNDTDFGNVFLREISRFPASHQLDLKNKAREYMRTLMRNLQHHIGKTLRTLG